MKPIALILLVVLAAGLYWMMSGETPAVDAPSLEPGVQHPGAVEQTSLPAASTATAPEAIATATERNVVETQSVPRAEQEPATILLAGQVILSEASGVRVTNLDGTLEVLCWTRDGSDRRTIGVRSGRFELDATNLEDMTIEDIRLAGRSAMLSPANQEFALDQELLLVLVTWAPVVRLSVVSAETSEHLSNVRLVQAGEWSRRSKQHPEKAPAKSVILAGGSSPIDVQVDTARASSNLVTYYVHSPGYAWQMVHINFASRGERELRLVRDGDLAIRLIGELPAGGAELCLLARPVGMNEPTVLLEATTLEAVTIDDMIPGPYLLRVQKGAWYQSPFVYGELEVEVVAGLRGEYELTLDALPVTTLARLAGTLVIPAAWGFASFSLRAEFVGTSPDGGPGEYRVAQENMKRIPTERDAWAFDFGEIIGGEYELIFSGAYRAGVRGSGDFLKYALEIEVLAALSGNVRLAVPPPANVSLQLLDAQSGEPAIPHSFSWGSIVPPARYPTEFNGISRGEFNGPFEFRVPVGGVWLNSSGGGFSSLQESVQVHAGDNEFSFHLHRSCPLEILFFDGESLVPLSVDWFPSPEHLDGDGRLLSTSVGKRGFAGVLDEPGRYLFRMPKFEGFEPIPDQTIAVVRGETTLHEVRLVREK